MIKLDIDTAIAAHKAWLKSFHLAIDGIDGDKLLDMSVADHSHCMLGIWLDSNQPEFFEHAELYNSIKEVHVEFHQLAGEVLGHLEHGETDAALRMLDKKLTLVSEALVLLLEGLQSKCFPAPAQP